MSNYKHSEWSVQVSKTNVPLWKSALYSLLRPWWNSMASRAVQPIQIAGPARIKYVSERGYSVAFRRKWATSGMDVCNSNIVVQGTGNGWDVVSWAKLRPRSIVAIDLFEFDSWNEIIAFCRVSYGVTVEFARSPLEVNFGLDASSIDLVASDAVYEHCTNLMEVMAETWRILRPRGRIYANYGPLWYCAGGDHFSGRDALRSSYNHLALDKIAYQEYVSKNTSVDEDYQDGARYIELDLFSKLSTCDYLAIYKEAGFTISDLWCEVSARALEFSRNYPKEMGELTGSLPNGCSINDLLIKAHHLRMTK